LPTILIIDFYRFVVAALGETGAGRERGETGRERGETGREK